MGGHSINVFGKGPDARTVYNDLVSRARSEHGSDPYSGTIATTGGFFTVCQMPLGPVGLRTMREEALNKCEKRGPCAALPVAVIKSRREQVFKVEATSAEEAHKLIAARLVGKEYVIKEVSKPEGAQHSGKIKKESYGGKRKVMFEMETRQGKRQFATQAEAVTEAEKILKERLSSQYGGVESWNGKVSGNTLVIRPVIVFEGGKHGDDKTLSVKVSIGAYDKKASFSVKVELLELGKDIEGWEFVGIAAS